MNEHHTIEVPRTARYHARGAPAASAGELWFLAHGYGQLAEPFLESLAALERGQERGQRRLIAPEALSRFYLRRGTGEVGASWMTRVERADEIRDVLRYLDLLWRCESSERAVPARLLAFGFSQGGAAAARWALLGEAPVAGVLSWGCPLPLDLELELHAVRARALRWSFVLGDQDQTIDRAAWEAGLERLRALGIQPEVTRFAGGHVLDEELLARLEL